MKTFNSSTAGWGSKDRLVHEFIYPLHMGSFPKGTAPKVSSALVDSSSISFYVHTQEIQWPNNSISTIVDWCSYSGSKGELTDAQRRWSGVSGEAAANRLWVGMSIWLSEISEILHVVALFQKDALPRSVTWNERQTRKKLETWSQQLCNYHIVQEEAKRDPKRGISMPNYSQFGKY